MRRKALIALYFGTLAGAIVTSTFSTLGFVLLAGASLLILTRKELNS
jgi:hypothetical protein